MGVMDPTTSVLVLPLLLPPGCWPPPPPLGLLEDAFLLNCVSSPTSSLSIRSMPRLICSSIVAPTPSSPPASSLLSPLVDSWWLVRASWWSLSCCMSWLMFPMEKSEVPAVSCLRWPGWDGGDKGAPSPPSGICFLSPAPDGVTGGLPPGAPPPPGPSSLAPRALADGGGGGGVGHMLNTARCSGRQPCLLSRSLAASGWTRIKARMHRHASTYSSSSMRRRDPSPPSPPPPSALRRW
mmetsp:Transcript_20454/g.46918  ORF Transcript_20454/g.46918 Transcript_20454/m.46918 type:complete len:238 (-) Transcript_20454:60-773(-)